MIRELCTRNVHETPDFTPISGVFRALFQMVIVPNKKNEARRQNRASFFCKLLVSGKLV